MARIKEMHLSLGQTVPIGKFATARADFGMTVELAAGDNEDQVFATLKRKVEARVNSLLENVESFDENAPPKPAPAPGRRPPPVRGRS